MEAQQPRPAMRRDEAPRTEFAGGRSMRHPIWLHPGVSDELRGWPHLYRRLGLVLRQLGARGETSVVKSCRASNRGWLRSPLGGSGGRQYYLWWTRSGSRRAAAASTPRGAILVRAVRHHDDHSPLAAGDGSDYLRLERSEDLNDDMAGRPWTKTQERFATDRAPIRLLIGRPGSGKTTALWRAVEARSGEHVLYLTWSGALRDAAEAHFSSFAPGDVEIDALDFRTFVGEITGRDVERETLARSRRRLDEAVTRAGRNTAGPWASRLDALHAELRAVLVGRALPAWEQTVRDGSITRLTDKGFARHREGSRTENSKAVRCLLKVARVMPSGTLAAIYPEIAAAQEAARRLDGGEVPERFRATDRIVVDEAQDLTLAELNVISRLCAAIAKRKGWSPWLLVAGDAGQTVLPTGFHWAGTSHMLTQELGTTKSFHLEDHVRCPRRIAEVVDRTTELYRGLNKEVRPEKQHRQARGEHVEARVMYVEVRNEADAERLAGHAAESDRTVLVTSGGAAPEWIPERHRTAVLTPAEAKGLEYQTVCVLDGGRALDELSERTRDGGSDRIEEEMARTAIDALRVALSRATEGLALVDWQPDSKARSAAAEVLGSPASWTVDDLVDELEQESSTPEEQVRVRLRDARALVDQNPQRAWDRALQAAEGLGDGRVPNGVADPAVRRDTRTTLLRTAARLIAAGDAIDVDRNEIYRKGTLWAALLGNETRPADEGWILGNEMGLLEALKEWADHGGRIPPVRLLEEVHQLRNEVPNGEDWSDAAMAIIAQRVRKGLGEHARDPKIAGFYTADSVQNWLAASGHRGNTAGVARTLAERAFDTMIEAARKGKGKERRRMLEEAGAVLESLGDDPRREGRLHEAAGAPAEAVAAYTRAGALDDRMRVWRNEADWENARDEAEGEAGRDIRWLLMLEKFVETRPEGQNRRLRPAERKRLSQILNRIQRRRVEDADDE